MEWVRQWLLGVISCSMLVSMTEQLCPAGSVRKAVRFAGALLLLLAMWQPLTEAELPEEMWSLGNYREALARIQPELSQTGREALAAGIAAELEAYIEDKAENLGVKVRSEMTMREQGEAVVPESVTLRGAYSEALSEWIASELGITKERQRWMIGSS